MQLNLFLIVVLLMNFIKTKLRNAEEILDEADLIGFIGLVYMIELMREATASMHESIVIERRRGLFWLINYKMKIGLYLHGYMMYSLSVNICILDNRIIASSV